MEIREPNPTELKEIFSLSPQAMFEGTMGRVKPTEQRIKELVDPLLNNGSCYLIATEENNILGWILIGSTTDQFSGTAIGFIYELYVKPNFRGKGISKQLMQDGINRLKSKGYSEIRLAVYPENHAIELYKKMGFSVRNISMSLQIL